MKRLQKISHKAVLFFAAILIAIAPIFNIKPVLAVSDSLWMEGELRHEVEGGADDGYKYGLPCQPGDISYEAYSSSGALVSMVSQNDCLFTLPFGGINRANTLYMPKMATKGGMIYDSRVIPVPNTDANTVFWHGQRQDIYGTQYIDRYKNGLLRKQVLSEGSATYSYNFNFNNAEHARVKWDNGQDLVIMKGQLAVSSNGKWMIARTDGGKVVRINLETLEILTAFDSGGGWPNSGGNYELAVSDDGSSGVVSGGYLAGGDTTQIIDFTTCGTSSPQNGDVTPGCGARDITSIVKSIDNNQTGKVTFPAFNIDNTQIQMNVGKDDNQRRISLIAPGEEYSKLDYLAMGDSFASGEGDTDDSYYEPGTNVSPSDDLPKGEKCHISKRSYPGLLAQKMAITSGRFKSVACSGARMVDVLNESNEGKGRYEGQFDQFELASDWRILARKKAEAVNNFIPGRAAQIEFVKKYKPKVITVSIGGNDVGFSSIIQACFRPGSQCDFAKDDVSHRQKKAVDVQNITGELVKLYQKIHNTSKKTKIYVLGYSKIIDKNGICSLSFGFDDKERRFIDEAFTYMNSVIEAAAKKAGVSYLDVENAIGKAGLCGNETPRAANGLRLGDDIASPHLPNVRLVGAESYHPNQHGHDRIANQIASSVNYTSCSSSSYLCPQAVDTPPIPAYFVNTNPEAQKTQIPLNLTEKALLLIKETLEVQIQRVFLPGSQVALDLHSEPVRLGDYVVDNQGSIEARPTLSDNIPAGYHTIRLRGTLLSGEPIELYQPILILGVEGDRDNNEVADASQECLLAPAAITDDTGKIILKPCGELDGAPETPGGGENPGDPPVENPPTHEEIVQRAEKAIWEQIETSNFFGYLNPSSQRLVKGLYENAKPNIKAQLLQCMDRPSESLVFQLWLIKLTSRCDYRESQFYVQIGLYLGPFRILEKSVIIEGE